MEGDGCIAHGRNEGEEESGGGGEGEGEEKGKVLLLQRQMQAGGGSVAWLFGSPSSTSFLSLPCRGRVRGSGKKKENSCSPGNVELQGNNLVP